jgi:hypothetical protein
MIIPFTMTPFMCYIWCAMDPIKINPSHVSIFLPAPTSTSRIRHGIISCISFCYPKSSDRIPRTNNVHPIGWEHFSLESPINLMVS